MHCQVVKVVKAFVGSFVDEVQQDSAHEAMSELQQRIGATLASMRHVKALIMEVSLVKAIEKHQKAAAVPDQDIMQKAVQVISQQMGVLASSEWDLQSDMIHPALLALSRSYLESPALAAAGDIQ